MKIKSYTTALAIILGNLFISTSANAQYVIKGNKCADFVNTGEVLEVYTNATGSTQTLTIQVVRDGCRPKLDGGLFRIRVAGDFGSSFRTLTRLGKRTAAYGRDIPANSILTIYFQTPAGVRVSGTFDYIFTVE